MRDGVQDLETLQDIRKIKISSAAEMWPVTLDRLVDNDVRHI